jgi:uncharacterized sulfatase
VHDFVNLMDLAPTFLEAAGVDRLPGMAAHSLLPVLASPASGQVDAARDHVVLGRERHVALARAGNKPYPQRAIRTDRYLYIRNFAPDRWPMGDPRGLDDPATEPPSYEQLCEDTWVAYADMDSSPSKAWMVHHRGEPEVRALFEMGFGKFPAEELYDLQCDPHYLDNVASDPAYAATREHLSARLMGVLRDQNDPRVTEAEECRFEHSPYTDPHTGF